MTRCTCGPADWWDRKDDRTHYAGCPSAEPWQFKREHQHEHPIHEPGNNECLVCCQPWPCPTVRKALNA